MMNVQTYSMIWDHLRQMNGIAMRLVDALPADQLDAHPVRNMRTPKELVAHVYGYVRSIPEGIASGTIQEPNEAAALATIRTKDDLVRYCTDCWKAGTAAGVALTDAQLAGVVKTPWGGTSMPGHVLVQVLRDEFTHHRGQLFAYVRAMGGDVPMMWDFEHNAPEYQPKAHAGA